MNPIIIHRPDLQRPANRALWTTVTWLFWVLWIYLWLPLITLIGWYFGVHTGLDQMVERLGYLDFLRALPGYALVIGCGGLTLIGWAYSQYLRFHGRERRSKPTTVTNEQMATKLGFSDAELRGWQSERSLTAFHEADGSLGDVRRATQAKSRLSTGQGNPLA